MSNLSSKHKLFCLEYLSNGNNGTKAYLSVYKSVTKESTAKAAASRLLTNVNVKAYIDKEMAKTSKKLEVTRESTIKSNLVHEQAYEKLLELSMKDKLTSEEESIFARMMMVVKATDAIRAREMNAKLLGLFIQDDEGKDIGDIKIDVQIRRNNNGDSA